MRMGIMFGAGGKSSNPKPMIATAAYITLGEHNLTVHRIPWRVRVGRCCRKSHAIGRALVVKILVAKLNLSDCARRIRERRVRAEALEITNLR